MRFETTYGPSQTELQATQFEMFGKVARDAPNGSAAWLATFLLLSTTAHQENGWMYPLDDGSATSSQDHPALLEWMLDNTPPEQQPAVQQGLLSVLTTASKLSLNAKGSKQLSQANEAFSGMLRTAVQVLKRLLPQPVGHCSVQAAAHKAAARKAAAAASAAASHTGGSGSAAAAASIQGTAPRSLTDTVTMLLAVAEEAGFLEDQPELSSMLSVPGTAASTASKACAATDSSIDDMGQATVKAQALQAAGSSGGSSSSSSSQGAGSAIQAAAQGHDSPGNSTDSVLSDSEQEASTAAAEDVQLQGEFQLETGRFDAEAVLAWLSLLGRCFVQACLQLTKRVQQHAAGSDVASGTRLVLRTPQQRVHDRTWAATELRSLCDLSATDLPRCIVRVAVLLSAAAGNPEQQLPKQKAVERPVLGKVPLYYENLDEGLSVGCQELQQLRNAGQLLSEKCSSLGFGFAAVQQSTWALAEAAAASAPLFHGAERFILPSSAGYEGLDPRGAVSVSDEMLQEGLLDCGLTQKQAREAVSSSYQGVRGFPEMTALAVLHSTPTAAYMQKLQVAGLALSSLPTAAACNNPSCSSVSGASKQGVPCKACSACHLAVYCQRSCQKQHWGVHKPICKAVQAAAASKV